MPRGQTAKAKLLRVKYEFIFNHPEYPVARWVKFLQVSKSGYYDWLSKRNDIVTKENAYKERVKKIFDDSGGTYGPDRICGVLRNQEHKASYRKVAYDYGRIRVILCA